MSAIVRGVLFLVFAEVESLSGRPHRGKIGLFIGEDSLRDAFNAEQSPEDMGLGNCLSMIAAGDLTCRDEDALQEGLKVSTIERKRASRFSSSISKADHHGFLDLLRRHSLMVESVLRRSPSHASRPRSKWRGSVFS